MDSVFEKGEKNRGEGGYPVKIPAGVKLTAWIAAIFFLFTPKDAVSEVVDRIVAVVNDSIITLSELNAATAVATRGLKGEVKDGKNIVETKSKVLDALIEKKLMKQAADKTGIEVSEKEIDNAIEDIKKQNNMTQEDLLLALAKNGLTYKEYREQLREDIRQVKFVSSEFRSRIIIEPVDIEDYYKRNIESFYGPPAYKIRLIFIARDDEKTMRAKLEAVMEELENGVDFKDVAIQYSDGPAASDGGDLGYVKSGELEAAIEGAAMQLKEEEVSGPIFTKNGINIIQLLENWKGEPRPIEEVGDEIRKALYEERMNGRYNLWLEDMKRVAHIEVRL
jgi:peptidyl-prolyl cis-trans isomerase SurA